MGLRDEIDAGDRLWAVPGPTGPYPPMRVSHNQKTRDIKALKKHGCDIEPHLSTGPRRGHIKLLCDALLDGLPGGPAKPVPQPAVAKAQSLSAAPVAAKKSVRFGPEDAELFACILGHFAWHNADNANMLVSNNGVPTLLKWLRCTDFTSNSTDAHIIYPMQRACLAALASVCRHGEECAAAVLNEGAEDVLEFVVHHDIGLRRSALRCLARMIPYSKRRPDLSPASIAPESKAWGELVMPMILKNLVEEDEAIRTAAAACALEAAIAGWASSRNFEEEERSEDFLASLIDKLAGHATSALQRAVSASAAAAALPVLLTIAQLSEDDDAIRTLSNCDGLLPLLTTWPPRSAEATSTGIDRAAAAAAAKALETLCEANVIRLSVRELQMLLTCASSDYTLPSTTLREALEATLEMAVSREEDISFLAQLMSTDVKAANGRVKLANRDCLTNIARKVTELLEKSPGKNAGAALESLVKALDHVQARFEVEAKGQEFADLRELLYNLRSSCGCQVDDGRVQYNSGGYSTSPDASPAGDGTRLPPIKATGSR